jgi:hypothetical protein
MHSCRVRGALINQTAIIPTGRRGEARNAKSWQESGTIPDKVNCFWNIYVWYTIDERLLCWRNLCCIAIRDPDLEALQPEPSFVCHCKARCHSYDAYILPINLDDV